MGSSYGKPAGRRAGAAARVVTAAALAGLLAFAATRPLRADDLTAEERSRAQGWIVRLEDDDEEVRGGAEAELAKLGERARPVLESARATARPESRRRIDALLALLDDAARTAAGAEWSGLRGGPQRSGVVDGSIPRSEPKLAWRVDVPDRAPMQGALAVTGDAVVTLSADGTVRCFAAETGSRRWLAVLDSGITASATLGGRRIVVPTAGGVVALDARDGREAWRVASDYGCSGAPAIVGRTVFVALRNRGVLGLDLGTGDATFERKLAPAGAPLADADLLVTGTEDGAFRSLDPLTGRDRWKLDLGTAPATGPTLAAPGVIVLMTHSRDLRALRASDGRTLWEKRLPALSPSESLSAAAGRVFVSDSSGGVHAYDAATGRELWNRNEGFVEMGAPAASPDAVCFGSRGRIGCRDAATGDFLWRIDVDVRECSSPVVAGGRVLALYSGSLCAYR